MFTYCVTRVVGIVSMMGKSKSNRMNHLESLNEWTQYHDLSHQRISDMKTYLHYKNTKMYYYCFRNRITFSETRLLSGTLLLQLCVESIVTHFLYTSRI